MNRELCQRYLDDPDANRAHLSECVSCAAIFEQLDSRVPERGVALQVEALPLASWEGSRYRSWPVVLGGALTVLAVASALFAAAGESPVRAVVAAWREAVPPANVLWSLLRLAGGAVQNAPGPWQVGVAIGFVLVNAVLIMLLRRAPRGIDA